MASRAAHRLVCGAIFAMASILGAVPAAADRPGDESGRARLSTLDGYERRTVRRVLRDNGWGLADDPSGKRIGEVHIVTLPAFAREDPPALRWFNRLQVETKPEVLRQDVLLGPGDPWNHEQVEETERLLRDPNFTAFAVALPVRNPDPKQVDLLVVVRDLWSLRPNPKFEVQAGTLSTFLFSITERNVLGLRKEVNASFEMNLGSFALGSRLFDSNVFGTQAEFRTKAAFVFTRGSGEFEGTRSETTLRYPLWNLEQTWGGELTVSHRDEVERQFRGTEPLEYDDPRTPNTRESAPWAFDVREFGLETRLLYATGEAVEHRFALGYRVDTQEATLPAAFPEDPQLRRSFRRDVMPPDERNSGPLFGYEAFWADWVVYRNVSTYAVAEERQIGPFVDLQVSPILRAFGSLQSFVEARGSVGVRVDIDGRGFGLFETGGVSRYWEGRLFDNDLFGRTRLVAPPIESVGRFVGRLRADALVDDTQNRLLFAGGRNGLRGYAIGAFPGRRRLLANVEFRTAPLGLGALRAGAIAFWDAGHSAESFGALRLRHDAGIGVRMLIPKFIRNPFRLDWALPVDPARNSFPGRLTLGFGQVF